MGGVHGGPGSGPVYIAGPGLDPDDLAEKIDTIKIIHEIIVADLNSESLGCGDKLL